MLKATNTTLGPLRPDDAPTLFDWINDRDDVLFNAPYRPVTWPEHLAWFDAVQRSKDTALFAIRDRATQALVGTCQLTGIHPVHRSAELRIRIGRAANRGKGHGTEAVRLLLDFAFRDLNLHRVWLHVFADNDRAIRVYQKCGFRDEGLLREAAHVDGEYQSIRVLAILRDEHARRDSPA
jgi:RimJ/RimL family protein N-acetyltransferase